jgi:C4-dicarboxylate transporter DctM subunit
MLVDWVVSLNLTPWQFLLVVNLLLLVVGAFMDILSAMFIFVPLLAPLAMGEPFNVDPMHFGIIFIVNLELGYLTPPVGLNLFVASTLFERPIEHLVRSVLPFLAIMFVGLMIVTYVPAVSVGFGRWIVGVEAPERVVAPTHDGELGDGDADSDEDGDGGELDLDAMHAEIERLRGQGTMSMEDMQREAELSAQIEEKLVEMEAEIERLRGQGTMSMEDMQREAELVEIVERYRGGGTPPGED